MKNRNGQTALILILLTAAALIFLAITLNWGRIAQEKGLMTIAADQAATSLASNVASYGEMQKQTYLNDVNKKTEQTGILLAIIMIIVTIIVTIVSWGSATPFMAALLIASIAMAVVNLVLQVVVVQPMITALWNKLQKNQPTTQQFYEQGIQAALQGSVGDQVSITDYFDSNTNGIYGITNNVPNDTVSRFALYYTDRLKMLNQPLIPQVVFFYNQLGELMNGETCNQNESDFSSYPNAIALNPACTALNPDPQYCIKNPIDPACQMKIPNGFQLSDPCTDSNPASPSYNPYCDTCCQPLNKPNPLNPGSTIPVRPTTCDQSAIPAQCLKNNPFGGSLSQNALLYDPTFQDYEKKASFLAQFGRDQQMGPFNSLMPQANPNGTFFPNGIYPFFWQMKDFSPEVDRIDPTVNALSPSSPALHWCALATAAVNGVDIPASASPAGFTDLAQLNLQNLNQPYSCQGKDCCVNFLADKIGSVSGVPTPIPDGTTNGTTNGQIDVVGSSNPVNDPSFGEGGTGTWLEGDNQMCLTSWPYNGANSNFLDGTCQWTGSAANPPPTAPASPNGAMTADNLDDLMHTLSDFDNFSITFLSNNTGTLSSTFQTWYPQVAGWIDPASNGRLLPLAANLSAWNSVITNWLNNIYTSPNAWCVPQPGDPSLNVNGSPTDENTYITQNGGAGPWGDLPHITACLNYNSIQSPGNYQQCLNLLNSGMTSGNCPASLTGTVCDPSKLGRSLAGPAPVAFNGNCNITIAGSYAKWVSDSSILATDEAPKFSLRYQFLNDIYTRAKTMQNIFNAGITALQNFLKPCGGSPTCADGGPAAQLIYASSQPSPVSSLPNSIIYGWVDNSKGNGHLGYGHIVKVTAYSPGRGGSFASSLLPWIKTKTSGFLALTRSFTLTNRDGPVYVSVKRWDEDHNPILFPNGHPLWQTLFHKFNGNTTVGQDLMQVCNGLTLKNSNTPIGFGLTPQTVAGLAFNNQISPADQAALSRSFMLNDTGDGKIDSAAIQSSGYGECLSQANHLLCNAPESHACVQYIASRNASRPSGDGDSDYSLSFVNCPSIPPEDLGDSANCG